MQAAWQPAKNKLDLLLAVPKKFIPEPDSHACCSGSQRIRPSALTPIARNKRSEHAACHEPFLDTRFCRVCCQIAEKYRNPLIFVVLGGGAIHLILLAKQAPSHEKTAVIGRYSRGTAQQLFNSLVDRND